MATKHMIRDTFLTLLGFILPFFRTVPPITNLFFVAHDFLLPKNTGKSLNERLVSLFQVGVVYICTRLYVNVSQSYLPLYLTETMRFEKVRL